MAAVDPSLEAAIHVNYAAGMAWASARTADAREDWALGAELLVSVALRAHKPLVKGVHDQHVAAHALRSRGGVKVGQGACVIAQTTYT